MKSRPVLFAIQDDLARAYSSQRLVHPRGSYSKTSTPRR